MLGNIDDVYEKLQSEADLIMVDPTVASDFNRPILNRLCDFVVVAITSLKLYPTSMVLQLVTSQRIEVRVAGLSSAVIVFAPVEQLLAEVYLNKMANTKQLPFPRILKQDVTFSLLPVAFAVYSFVAGISLHTVTDEPMLRVAARQVGRTLRSLHVIAPHGIGAPQPSGKWTNRTWASVLYQWMTDTMMYERLLELLGPKVLNKLLDETCKHESLQHYTAAVLFGDIQKQSVLVQVHGNIQVEGLTRSGRIVAGDPMFDVASTMRNSLGQPFRQGFFEGYTMHAPISTEEIARVKRYAVLWRSIDALSTVQSAADKSAFAQSVTHVLSELSAAS